MTQKLLCALTGHRKLPADFDKNALSERLLSLIEGGCTGFFCGMAPGFDLLALECLVRFKKQGIPVYLEACIPYPGQENYFPQEIKEKYRTLLSYCDERKVIFDRYCNGCFLARDRYMVDRADFVFAYLNRGEGGTAYTVRYAKGKGLAVIFC